MTKYTQHKAERVSICTDNDNNNDYYFFYYYYYDHDDHDYFFYYYYYWHSKNNTKVQQAHPAAHACTHQRTLVWLHVCKSGFTTVMSKSPGEFWHTTREQASSQGLVRDALLNVTVP